MKNYDGLIPLSIMVNAAETDDQVGALLRFHLLIERLLVVFLEFKISEKKLDQVPRLFGKKIEKAESLDLPKKICDVIRCINDLRNSIAHIINGKFTDTLDNEILQDLKNKVGELHWVKNIGGIDDVQLSLPLKSGEKVFNINENPVTDLIILALSLLVEMTQYIKSLERLDYSKLK